jgi:hypothetical protein
MKTYCDECRYGKYSKETNCDIICSYKESKDILNLTSHIRRKIYTSVSYNIQQLYREETGEYHHIKNVMILLNKDNDCKYYEPSLLTKLKILLGIYNGN